MPKRLFADSSDSEQNHNKQQQSDTHNLLASFTSLQTIKSTQRTSSASAAPNVKRKHLKETKFKEITRTCLYHPDHYLLAADQPRCKQNLIQFIAKEFLTDSRQRLDLDTFKKLLILFTKPYCDNLETLNEIYQLIKSDFILCNKFSAFLTSETALHFDLFTQYSQYKKCFEFLQKLEILVPNKCTFRKLITSINAACNASYENETVANKIEDIKAKIKSVAGLRNNTLIEFELEYLFDQRWANLEPTYEKISLVDELDCLDEEYIDLTQGFRKRTSDILIAENCTGKVKTKKPMGGGRVKSANKIMVTMKKHGD